MKNEGRKRCKREREGYIVAEMVKEERKKKRKKRKKGTEIKRGKGEGRERC